MIGVMEVYDAIYKTQQPSKGCDLLLRHENLWKKLTHVFARNYWRYITVYINISTCTALDALIQSERPPMDRLFEIYSLLLYIIIQSMTLIP